MLTDLFQFALFQLKTGLGLTFPQFFSKMFDTVILLDVAHTVKAVLKHYLLDCESYSAPVL